MYIFHSKKGQQISQYEVTFLKSMTAQQSEALKKYYHKCKQKTTANEIRNF